jgi:beta-phosphoglucomutase-like phosphatase (HAD superfamily)
MIDRTAAHAQAWTRALNAHDHALPLMTIRSFIGQPFGR